MKKNNSSPFDLSAKNILVIGGAGTIGQSISSELHNHGSRVIIADKNINKSNFIQEKLGPEVLSYKLDINKDEDLIDLKNSLTNQNINLDALINTSYPQSENYGASFDEVTREQWEKNLNAHLGGYFASVKLLNDILTKKASIILLGSIYGFQAPDFNLYDDLDMTSPVEYSGIKGGLINLTRYLASWFGKKKDSSIRVNCISPGGIKNTEEQPDKFIKRYQKKTPMNRMAEPEDVAGAAVFLASNASSYITGHNLVVDGGYTIQ